MSFGRGRLSRSSVAGAVSSSSMISLHRSMHSSQMYTPGPAMSFFTCRWLLPQKLHSSCSFPSLALATSLSFYPEIENPASPDRLAVLDHVVDDAVVVRFLRSHEVVAIHVPRNLFELLTRVVGHDL